MKASTIPEHLRKREIPERVIKGGGDLPKIIDF
jgi:hypothetical protein